MPTAKIPTATVLRQFFNALLQQQKSTYKSMSQVQLWELVTSSSELQQAFASWNESEEESEKCDGASDPPMHPVHTEHMLDTKVEVVEPKPAAKRAARIVKSVAKPAAV